MGIGPSCAGNWINPLSDLLTKAKALEYLAIGEKRRAFERLKAEDEDSAQFVTDIAKAFGKPSAISIQFKDGSVYRSGTFKHAQSFPDFRKRCELQPSS